VYHIGSEVSFEYLLVFEITFVYHICIEVALCSL